MEKKDQQFNINKVFIILSILLPISFCIGQAAVSIYFFFCFIIFLYFFFTNNNFFLNNNLITISLIIFFLLIITANIFSIGFVNIFDKSLLYLRFLFFFLLGKLAFQYINKKFNNYEFFYFLFLSILIFLVLIDGYYQYFNITKENIFGFKPLPEHFQRLTGVFGKEPIIGSFLFHIGFPAIIFLISYISDKVSNLFYNFFLISVIIFFYLTLILISGERTSILMALLGFSIVIILFQKNKIKICLSFVFFILFFYLMILYHPYVKQRYSDFISETTLNRLFNTKTFQDNSNNRTFFDSQWGAHYLTAFEMFKSEPFFGIGVGQFRNNCSDKKYDNIKSSSKDIRCSSHPHNIYLEIFAETGVFTGISFLIFIVFFFYKIIKIIFSKNLKKIKNTIQYNVFLSFFAVSFIILFPFKATGSFFSNFYGSFIWYNLTILYIYLLYFQNLLKRKYR